MFMGRRLVRLLYPVTILRNTFWKYSVTETRTWTITRKTEEIGWRTFGGSVVKEIKVVKVGNVIKVVKVGNASMVCWVCKVIFRLFQ